MFHPQRQARFKELARTSRSHIARDALLLLVHPEWRKSRSTPRPITVFTTRCHDAHCTACVVLALAICFHEPVSNGYGGIRKATVWRVGRVLFAVSRCSARRRQILKRNGYHRWEEMINERLGEIVPATANAECIVISRNISITAIQYSGICMYSGTYLRRWKT